MSALAMIPSNRPINTQTIDNMVTADMFKVQGAVGIGTKQLESVSESTVDTGCESLSCTTRSCITSLAVTLVVLVVLCGPLIGLLVGVDFTCVYATLYYLIIVLFVCVLSH